MNNCSIKLILLVIIVCLNYAYSMDEDDNFDVNDFLRSSNISFTLNSIENQRSLFVIIKDHDDQYITSVNKGRSINLNMQLHDFQQDLLGDQMHQYVSSLPILFEDYYFRALFSVGVIVYNNTETKANIVADLNFNGQFDQSFELGDAIDLREDRTYHYDIDIVLKEYGKSELQYYVRT